MIRAGRASVVATDRPNQGDEGLQARVERLEAMVEALQDQLYRHECNTDQRFHDVQRRLEPDEMARALSADARARRI
jgi:hypothetical protein